MHATTTTADLTQALTSIAKVTPKKHASHYVTLVRLGIFGEAGSIRGTDLETYADAQFPVKLDGNSDLSALVDPRDLLTFCKAAEGVELTLSLEGDALKVNTDAGESIELATKDADEFPCWPDSAPDSPELGSIVDAVDLSSNLARTAVAAARDQGRYSMHGVRVELPTDSLVRLIATDGRRLHISEFGGGGFGAPAGGDDEPRALEPATMPLGTVKALGGILPKKYRKGEEPRAATLAQSMGADGLGLVSVTCPGPVGHCVTVTARALAGDFPRYSAVRLDSPEGEFRLDAGELLKRSKLVSAACSDDARGILFGTADGNTERLTVTGSSAGKSSTAELPGASIVSWPMTEHMDGGAGRVRPFAVSPDYLADAVKAAGDDRVALHWQSRTSPIEVRSADGFVGVVMPITINR